MLYWRVAPAELVHVWFQRISSRAGNYISGLDGVITCGLCSCVTKSSWKHFDFDLRRMISEHKFNHYLALYPLTPKRHTPHTMCLAPLVSESVICARGGIGSCGPIVTPWQMMSVCLWNCSQSCKTDPMSTEELEPIQRDTQQITAAWG